MSSELGTDVGKKLEAWERESTWLSLAIAATIIIGVVGVPFATWWIYSAATDEASLRRVQILAPFGILSIAVTTFLTIVWRGLISARQADTGLRQLDSLRVQINATEENNLATQLQKGAELIADEKTARVAAGIATLGSVAKAKPGSFGDEARVLLIDFVRDFGELTHESNNVRKAASALASAYAARPAAVVDYLSFSDRAEVDDPYSDVYARWEIIYGARKCEYTEGVFFSQTLALDRATTEFVFTKVTFAGCTIIDLSKFLTIDCKFMSCKIFAADALSLRSNSFDRCEFSGSKITINDNMPDLRPGKNWFHWEHAPTVINDIAPSFEIEEKLNAWGPPDDDDESHLLTAPPLG